MGSLPRGSSCRAGPPRSPATSKLSHSYPCSSTGSMFCLQTTMIQLCSRIVTRSSQDSHLGFVPSSIGLGFAGGAGAVVVTVCVCVTVWATVMVAVTVLVAAAGHVDGPPPPPVTVTVTVLPGVPVLELSGGTPPPHRPKTELHPSPQYSVVFPQ